MFTLVEVAAVQAWLLQCVTRKSPLVWSLWLMMGRPSAPIESGVWWPTLFAVSTVFDCGGVPMGSQSTVPFAWMPRRYCPAGQVPNPAAAVSIAPGASCADVTPPAASWVAVMAPPRSACP